jgi:hypothetical protein
MRCQNASRYALPRSLRPDLARIAYFGSKNTYVALYGTSAFAPTSDADWHPLAGATPPAVSIRCTNVTCANRTPPPLPASVDEAFSSSHGIAPGATKALSDDDAASEPCTRLESFACHVGSPAPAASALRKCVPTCSAFPLPAYNVACGPYNVHAKDESDFAGRQT